MELNRSLFSTIEKKLRTNPKAGLNGEIVKFRDQLDLLGKSGEELIRNTTPQQRAIVRHAVMCALGLRRAPNTGEVATALNDLYAEIELVGQDTDACSRVQLFARYIGSTAP